MNTICRVSPRRLFASALAVWLLLSGAVSLSAHPTATSFVVIRTGAAIDVEITTEAESLLMKLEALAGVVRPAPLATPVAVEERLRSLNAVLLQQIELRLDDAPMTLAVTNIDRVKDRPELVRITVSGRAASTATTLRWRTRLFFGSYPLAVRSGSAAATDGAAEEYEWLSGP
jgi:hypothetical protein